eukprot:5630389-Amphidinium_carterae.1
MQRDPSISQAAMPMHAYIATARRHGGLLHLQFNPGPSQPSSRPEEPKGFHSFCVHSHALTREAARNP